MTTQAGRGLGSHMGAAGHSGTAGQTELKHLAAVDLGATSGRVILGRIEGAPGAEVLRMRHVARFPNNPVRLTEGSVRRGSSAGGATGRDAHAGFGLHWNITSLYEAVEAGLTQAAALAAAADGGSGGLDSIGVDSWAVDYGLLRGGRLLGVPYHYRDERTARGVELVHGQVGPAELFERCGLQHLDFNTVFQLAVEQENRWLDLADRILLLPDLLTYWLTGVQRAEVTNASTTGLLDVRTREWDAELMGRLGYSGDLFPQLVAAGERVGLVTEAVGARLGTGPVPVHAVGSHDTASAVVAVPMTDASAAYISSGTWSLVGLELDAPVVTAEARAANFTNEGGVDGRVRFLKNVSGLWLLNESMRTWERTATGEERASNLAELLAAAEAVEGPVPTFDAGDDVFVAPGDMPARIQAWFAERGIAGPRTKPEIVRSILESLAVAYAQTIADAERLSGTSVETIHVVGGGSQNALLCRLTAQRSGKRVVAGPVEATAMGNLLVQARAVGALPRDSSLEDLRQVVIRSGEVTTY